MLLDSNLIIYSAKPEHAFLKQFILDSQPYVSWVSRIEVLGFHRLTEEHKQYFDEFFNAAAFLPVDWAIVVAATGLRQQRSMTLGDALLAATALYYDVPLATRNVDDFKHITGLHIVNPFDSSVQ
ncbi:MAG: type II toxin-antitoxin system VapC family toxin [Cytophagales bacterium]|nr:MAG: type II toxin-antitoxin system VapC family toxin [Cytophagales bacterium]